jgi:N6-adenosine-specific RNA methylase IME4
MSEALPHTVRARGFFAAAIEAAWQKSLAGILEAGQLLIEAKVELAHGEFLAMIAADLPFKARTGQRLMAVARDQRLANAAHCAAFPPHWATLYELTKLDDESFQSLLAAGVIRPDMERKDVAGFVKKKLRAQREQALGAAIRALPEKRYGVILADPEWQFKFWSEKGMTNSSADNHYPTSPLDVIKARNVASIAANDCALFMWTTAPFEGFAHEVIKAWGFEYRSQVIWKKDKAGTGFWFLNQHEILTLSTRGAPPAPAPGTLWPSVIEASVGEHSEKPEIFYDLIESYFPNLPKIELNARKARLGWDSWGLEATREAAE